MNILVVDSQDILTSGQRAHARDHLYYSLLRYGHRVQGATMHFSRGDEDRLHCAVHVSLQDTGIVSAERRADRFETLMSQVTDRIDRRIACRLDWRAWFDKDAWAGRVNRISQSLSRRIRSQLPARPLRAATGQRP